MVAVPELATTNRRGWRSVAALLAGLVLALATAYEAAQALGVISIGELPGDDAPGADYVGAAASIAFLLALVVVASSLGARAETITRPVRVALPLVTVATVVVGYVTYDPYYAPSLRRYSDYASSGETLDLRRRDRGDRHRGGLGGETPDRHAVYVACPRPVRPDRAAGRRALKPLTDGS